MLYTRKGDDGTTKNFSSQKRISKSSCLTQALGDVDELNSWLGICRAKVKDEKFSWNQRKIYEITEEVQQNLFIIQAELAGAPGKSMTKAKVSELEHIVDGIEKEMPKIQSFFLPGASEPGAFYDYARAVARRAERSVISALEQEEVRVGDQTKAYLNRLSSLLYALARYTNLQSGVSEKVPHYK